MRNAAANAFFDEFVPVGGTSHDALHAPIKEYVRHGRVLSACAVNRIKIIILYINRQGTDGGVKVGFRFGQPSQGHTIRMELTPRVTLFSLCAHMSPPGGGHSFIAVAACGRR
jgi:hypothetical protein